MPGPEWVDLLAIERDGPDGAVWSLPPGGDVNANLVRLAPKGSIGAHVNEEVDVLLVGIAGRGSVVIDAIRHALGPGTLIAIPKGAARTIAADGDDEVVYLTVHRARPGLRVTKR